MMVILCGINSDLIITHHREGIKSIHILRKEKLDAYKMIFLIGCLVILVGIIVAKKTPLVETSHINNFDMKLKRVEI